VSEPYGRSEVTSGLSIAHINVNGLDVEGRMEEFGHIFQNKPFDIIGINETKLTKNDQSKDFKLDGYELYSR
jgi:exonuclease III